MADFYNLADQKLFKDYQFLPQEKYRLGLNLPTDATEDEVVTDEGIVNTNAFANSGGGGDFSPTGNMFGEGTAVSPVYGNTYIDTVRREGPESRQAVEALINAGGSALGGLMPQEYGFQFTGIPTERGDVLNEFDSINYDTDNIVQGQTMGGSYTDDMDYSKSAFDSLESENEKRGFLSKMFNKAGQIKSKLPSWAQAGITALNPFSIIPNLLSGIGGDGPKYGIAGLTDQQKGLYDSLASQGMLFNTPSGMKTFDGKNFSQVDEETYDNYFDNKIDKFGSLKAYEDYLDAEPDLRKNLRKVYEYNKIGYTGLTGNDDIDDARQKKSDAIIKNEMLIREIRKAAAKRKNEGKDSGTTSNNTTNNTGTVSTTSPDYTPVGPNQPDPSNNDGGTGEGPSNRGRNSSQPGGGFNQHGFSDIRLKENVELIGKSPSNINIYKFNYKDSPTTYQGAMAHEVPWASVQHSNGYMMIDYSKIDVKLKKI